MRKNLMIATATAALLISAVTLHAADAAEALLPLRQSPLGGFHPLLAPDESKWQKRWAVSLAPLAVSQSLDAASSYGRRELNPLLASSNGGFGMRAAGIKFGVTSALAGVEYFLVRKYPRSAKFFTIVNWTAAGATSALAVHNFRLPGD